MLHDSPVSSSSFPPSHPPYLSLFFSVQHPGLKILRSDSSSSISSRIGWNSLLSVVWKLSFFFLFFSFCWALFHIPSALIWSGLVAAHRCVHWFTLGDSEVTSRSLILSVRVCVAVGCVRVCVCDVSPPCCCLTLSFVSLCDSRSWMFLLPRYLDFLPLLLTSSLHPPPFHTSVCQSRSICPHLSWCLNGYYFECVCPGCNCLNIHVVPV